MKKILSYKDYNQEINEGWRENLFAGAISLISLTGRLDAQSTNKTPTTIDTTVRKGTQVDGIIGEFTSIFRFPGLLYGDANKPGFNFRDEDFIQLGIEKNSNLKSLSELTTQQMNQWNDFRDWMANKGYSGNKDMNHKKFSQAVLDEYKMIKKDFWVKSEEDVKKVQKSIKGYRVYSVERWKSGKGSISLDNGKTTIPWSQQAESLFMPWAI